MQNKINTIGKYTLKKDPNKGVTSATPITCGRMSNYINREFTYSTERGNIIINQKQKVVSHWCNNSTQVAKELFLELNGAY